MFDRIYTVGCFDYLHHGHVKLLEKMRKMGKQIIVGIHDDQSLEKLKNLKDVDHQPIKMRMENIKKYADIVFVVPSTDPSFYLNCVISDDSNKHNSCYIRADDMPNFPGKDIVEGRVSLIFLPYTHGISSTMIRMDKSNKEN